MGFQNVPTSKLDPNAQCDWGGANLSQEDHLIRVTDCLVHDQDWYTLVNLALALTGAARTQVHNTILCIEAQLGRPATRRRAFPRVFPYVHLHAVRVHPREGLQILVQWRHYPPSLMTWEGIAQVPLRDAEPLLIRALVSRT